MNQLENLELQYVTMIISKYYLHTPIGQRYVRPDKRHWMEFEKLSVKDFQIKIVAM